MDQGPSNLTNVKKRSIKREGYQFFLIFTPSNFINISFAFSDENEKKSIFNFQILYLLNVHYIIN